MGAGGGKEVMRMAFWRLLVRNAGLPGLILAAVTLVIEVLASNDEQ
jgi:hypothetical protein